MDKVIAHFQDGRILKGHTLDFDPTRSWFNLTPLDYTIGGKPTRVQIPDLKGLFFVRNFKGNPSYHKVNTFNRSGRVLGQKVQVTFQDGEVLQGLAQTISPQQLGFYVVPADRYSNNQRCYIVKTATTDVFTL